MEARRYRAIIPESKGNVYDALVTGFRVAESAMRTSRHIRLRS